MSKLVVVAVAAVFCIAGVGAFLALRDEPTVIDDGGTAPPNAATGTSTAVAPRVPERRFTEPKPPVADEEGPPIPEMTAEPVPGTGLVFKFAECPTLSVLDWDRIGVQMRRSQRQLRKAAARLRQGDNDPLGPGGGVSDAYYQLMLSSLPFVRTVVATEIDMSSPISTLLSYPPYQANALAATLKMWQRPLREDQMTQVQAMYAQYLTEWNRVRDRVRAGPQLDTWPVQAIAEISIARATLQPKLEAVLDESQRAAIWPPSLKGRVGLDVFSPAMIWQGRISLVLCPEGTSVAKTWVEMLLSELFVDPPEREARRAILTEWFEALPKQFRQGLKGPLTRAELPAWEDIEGAVFGTPELIRRLAEGITRTDLPTVRSQKLQVPIVVAR